MITRAIPPQLDPLIQQSLLNMFSGCTIEEIRAARSAALADADGINARYESWLAAYRNLTADPLAAATSTERRASDGDRLAAKRRTVRR